MNENEVDAEHLSRLLAENARRTARRIITEAVNEYAASHGLTEEEFAWICYDLGRYPTIGDKPGSVFDLPTCPRPMLPTLGRFGDLK